MDPLNKADDTIIVTYDTTFCVFSLFADIGASAFGRDYLSTNESGHTLIDVFCTVLAETPISPQWFEVISYAFNLLLAWFLPLGQNLRTSF